MTEIVFEHNGQLWERTGDCNRCGQCCQGDPFLGGEGEAVVEGMCPLYRALNGLGHCSDRQHSYYLSGCVTFPVHPDQIKDKPNCSYVFTKVAS